jgi:hypothetical protein
VLDAAILGKLALEARNVWGPHKSSVGKYASDRRIELCADCRVLRGEIQ